MNIRREVIAKSIAVLVASTVASVTFAADFTRCEDKNFAIVKVADTMSCNKPNLSYANIATTKKVTVNLVRIRQPVGTGVKSAGLTAGLNFIPQCEATVIGGGSKSSPTCSSAVGNHQFSIVR